MADSRSGSFSRVIQKHAGRTKERILQNLGKADRTTDEIFNYHLSNFNRQQSAASKFQKEFKNYVSCVRAMQAASKSLMETLIEMYDKEWVGHDQLPVKAQALEMLWEDFCHKINDQIGIPLTTYINQFPEIRTKVAKRGRKVVDYDRSRHNLQALQQNSRKRDELKISKAKERLDNTRRLYEVINNELHDELPALFDSRIPFLVTNLQTLFLAETHFHDDNSKIQVQLCEMMENLASETHKGRYITRKPGSPLLFKSPDGRHYEEIEFKKGRARMIDSAIISNDVSLQNTLSRTDNRISPSINRANALNREDQTLPRDTTLNRNIIRKDEKEYEPVDISYENEQSIEELNMKKSTDELYDIPVGATTIDLPPGVLYRVRATYKYTAEDVDELSFETGEAIRVIEYDDPEEQEEGWLLGIKESSGEKGLFPANFSRPI